MKNIEKVFEHLRTLPAERQAEIINAEIEPPCKFCIHFDGEKYKCDDFDELDCTNGIRQFLEKDNDD